jgi:ankyrin repeat protein
MFVVRGAAGASPGQLFDAAAAGDVGRMERSIRDGAPVDATDGRGRTALDYAVDGGHMEAVAALVSLGADVDHRDADGGAPLLYTHVGLNGKGVTYSAERDRIAEFLVRHGADVRFVYDSGETMLHGAVARQNGALVRLLLGAGADPNAKNGKGLTPMDFAQFPDNSDSAIIAMLRAAGGRATRDWSQPALVRLLPAGFLVLWAAAAFAFAAVPLYRGEVRVKGFRKDVHRRRDPVLFWVFVGGPIVMGCLVLWAAVGQMARALRP